MDDTTEVHSARGDFKMSLGKVKCAKTIMSKATIYQSFAITSRPSMVICDEQVLKSQKSHCKDKKVEDTMLEGDLFGKQRLINGQEFKCFVFLLYISKICYPQS